MKFIKKVTENVKRGVVDFVRKPKVRAALKDAAEFTTDVAEAADKTGDKIAETYQDVKTAAEPVTKPVGKALDVVAEGVSHVEHASKTGDFGKQVLKLQEEEAEAKADSIEAEFALHVAVSELIGVQASWFALNTAARKAGKDSDPEVAALLPDPEPIDVDLFGDQATDLMEKLGLGEAAEKVKVVRELLPFGLLTPVQMQVKQFELAQQRRALSDNIAAYEEKTKTANAERKRFEARTRAIESKIAEMKRAFAAADIDLSPTSQLELELQAEEAKMKHAVAKGMLEQGMAPELVAQLTDIPLEELPSTEA